MNNKAIDRWNSFKRVLLVLFSILLWCVSIVFSYIGFRSDVRQEWYFSLFALILSGAITAMELYLNSQNFDFDGADVGTLVLWIGGLFCYAYGIWTNIAGLSIMMINPNDVRWQAWVVPVIAGVLLEVLPEPMFVAFLKSKKIEKPQPQEQRRDDTRNKVARGHFEPRPVDRVPDEIHRLHKIPSAPMPRSNR